MELLVIDSTIRSREVSRTAKADFICQYVREK